MRTILTGIILSVLAISVQAATYTVDPGGTEDYTTISAAVAAAADGDTVIVNDGTYQESITFTTGVRLLAAAGTTPTIQYDGVGTAAGAVIQCTDGNDTTIVDGFIISGDSGADTVGTIISSRQYGSASGLKIFRNCTISRFATYAFHTEQNQSHVIEDCEIYDGAGAGIYSRADGANSSVSRCSFHDIGSGGWNNCAAFLYNGDNYTFNGNVVYNCNRYGFMFRACAAVIVSNNIIFDNSNHGLYEYENNADIVITNNTIYNCNRGLSLYADSAKVIQNNIIWGNSTDIYANANTFLPGNVAYNCFSSVTNVDTAGMNNVYTDPLFVNTTAGSYDFTLQGTSPCLNAGSDSDDMGAYGGTSPNGYSAPLPVELTSFSATAAAEGIVITWTTATETDNLGFNVLRSVDGGAFAQINTVLIPGAGTTALPQSYSFTDAAPVAGASYKLEQVDAGGTKSYSAVVSVDGTSGIINHQFAIADFSLTNPGNGSAAITLPAAAKATVTVLGTDGTVMATRTGTFAAGTNLVGSDLPAGTYFVRITTEQNSAVKRMIVVK